MRTLPLIAALLMAAPALAQTPPADPAQKSPADAANSNVQPGTGGKSKAGQPGLPGNKSGASQQSGDSATSAPPSASEGASSGAAGSDDSGVPGKPGNKSGESMQK